MLKWEWVDNEWGSFLNFYYIAGVADIAGMAKQANNVRLYTFHRENSVASRPNMHITWMWVSKDNLPLISALIDFVHPMFCRTVRAKRKSVTMNVRFHYLNDLNNHYCCHKKTLFDNCSNHHNEHSYNYQGPLLLTWTILIPAWISNCIHSKEWVVCCELTMGEDSFLNFHYIAGVADFAGMAKQASNITLYTFWCSPGEFGCLATKRAYNGNVILREGRATCH